MRRFIIFPRGSIGPIAAVTYAMRLVLRPWQRCVAVGFTLAAFPATPAQSPPLTASSVMPVTIEIAASCTLSASDLDFGPYRPDLPTPALAQTVIQLQCAPGITAELLLDAGTGA